MKKGIIAIISCISWGLHGQVALPTFQAVQYSELYSFSSHTFTNCGATLYNGPTLANCKSSYNTSWEDDTEFFNVQTQGIQEWTVPSTGTYRIEAYGAQGGNGSGSSTGGLGARMRGDFSLTKGEVIKIMVGQLGTGATNVLSAGGGGGTFVIKSPYNNTASILVIAGGGGGEAQNSTGTPAGQTTNNGAVGGNSGGSAGTGGNAGGSVHFATGGAGFSGNSSLINYRTDWIIIAYSFVNGGVGAEGASSTQSNYTNYAPYGGFGGCGASCGCGTGGGGGGPQQWGSYAFGGGGSYNSGSNTSNSSGARSGQGQVIITKQ